MLNNFTVVKTNAAKIILGAKLEDQEQRKQVYSITKT